MDAIIAYLILEQNKKKKKNLPSILVIYSKDNIIQQRFDVALNFLIHFSWVRFQGEGLQISMQIITLPRNLGGRRRRALINKHLYSY
jgi:hypothetical protein